MGDESCRETATARAISTDVQAMLGEVNARLRGILANEMLLHETPLEATTDIELAVQVIEQSIAKLRGIAPEPVKDVVLPGGPTRQQGQFLAYIREYMLRNYDGLAPTHAVLQRHFNLTPPSVNSMLIRLEKRGFIRRTPHQARGIELSIAPDRIPPLDRPFRG